MELRERRVALIVRDFCEAYTTSERIGTHLRAGDLDFARVERLVGESEQSTLYRLKEECHALFRVDAHAGESQSELHAEELFDLAVGALFHEAMRFRESYYMTTAYGPRLDRMLAEGKAAGPLVAGFQRLFEAGHRRMLESHVETRALLRETREQLRILLRQASRGGVLARSLVEHRARTEQVFEVPLPELLGEVFGSAEIGYRLAVESLVQHGHYAQASALLDRDDVCAGRGWEGAKAYVEGLDRYYGGEPAEAAERLGRWLESGAPGSESWAERARCVLERIASAANGDTRLRDRAATLADRLRTEYRS
jgi:hypothetical protein